jgi:hypothetical protein|tara:strand:+ start:54 stop:242 length:189 start_codon:yes stop_codon:yes gene_type:complete
MIEDKDSIDMWINTCKNMPESILITSKKNDIDKLLIMLKLFRKATEKLETILKISKEERITA